MATVKAIVVPVDPKEDLRVQEIDNHDLDAYRALVGGNIEVVNLQGPPACMYINEDGKSLDYPVNARATQLMWMHNNAFLGRDALVGPAFIVGPPDFNGDDTTVPHDLLDWVFNTKRWRVQVKRDGRDGWQDDPEVFTDWFECCVFASQLTLRLVEVDEVRVVPVLDDELREQWYQIGKANIWIREATDPPFTRDSFVGCYSVDELADRLTAAGWVIGAAFYYRDLCFIQQVDGGDEWLTIRHGIPFESMTLTPRIKAGEFPRLIRRLLAATKEHCERLTY